MVANVGSADRMVRVALALICFAGGIYYESLWGLVGIVPLATAFLSWCPAYMPFKLSTVGKKDCC